MLHVEAKSSHTLSTDPAASAKPRSGDASQPNEQIIDEAVVAAIALALELEGQPEASRIATQRGTSFWALSGRARVLRGH